MRFTDERVTAEEAREAIAYYMEEILTAKELVRTLTYIESMLALRLGLDESLRQEFQDFKNRLSSVKPRTKKVVNTVDKSVADDTISVETPSKNVKPKCKLDLRYQVR